MDLGPENRDESSSFTRAFGIGLDTRVLALVGAGGKTSTMGRLAHELVLAGRKVITTTTTRIMRPGPDQGLFLLEGADDLFTLKLALDRSGHITVGSSTHRGKVLGVNPDFPIQLAGLADHVIVEADGAAGMSVKAPKDWEPVLPEAADLVIGLVGLDCIGRSITEENVFRLDRFMELTGLDRGSHIGLDAVRTLALAKDGLFKGVDHQMVCALFLNKSDTMDNKPNWAQFADSIFSRGPARVRRLVVGSAMLGRVAEFHVKNH